MNCSQEVSGHLGGEINGLVKIATQNVKPAFQIELVSEDTISSISRLPLGFDLRASLEVALGLALVNFVIESIDIILNFKYFHFFNKILKNQVP